MDTTQTYREIVQKTLKEYAAIRYSHGDIQNQAVFDREGDHYLVVSVGWDKQRVHGCVIHIDLIGDKVWVQRDNTENGIADELAEAGIPKEHIVIGFRRPELRQYTGYAVV